MAKGSRGFWQTMKTFSGRGVGQRRKAAPSADDVAKYFATKKSLPGEEGKKVPPWSRRRQGPESYGASESPALESLIKSVGPDGVSPRVLKHCAGQLVPPLTRLFQKIGKAAEFPTSWKVARVTPVYKKEDASVPKNYRPFSVLPTLATTFERVLMPQLASFPL